MKNAQSRMKRFFAPFVLVSALAISGCGSSDDGAANGVGGVGAGVGPGYGVGGCVPLGQPIQFVIDGVYNTTQTSSSGYVQGTIYGGNETGFGRSYLGTKAIGGNTRTGTGTEGSISVTGVTVGGYQYPAADIVGLATLSQTKIDQIMMQMGYGGGGCGSYGCGGGGYIAPQAPSLCVSDVAVNLFKKNTNGVYNMYAVKVSNQWIQVYVTSP